MANTYFQFKQFLVNQDSCGMKVTTDACLFGAWIANYISNHPSYLEDKFDVLDIGTGTGLISLMLAQVNSNIILDGVEIDSYAAKQAAENFKTSPFNQQLQVFQEDIKQFNAPKAKGYSFIITNPPFFNNDLKSQNKNRNLAMHSLELSLEDLILNIKRLLRPDGTFAILLPFHRNIAFIDLAMKEGFKLIESLFVRQTIKHPFFRSILLFSKDDLLKNNDISENELTIKLGEDYSEEFKNLLKPYYLKL